MTDPEPPPTPAANRFFLERILEWLIFSSRWLLAPIFLGLATSLIVILGEFVERTIELLRHIADINGNAVIIGVLAQIDLALTGSLVLMVMFAGYENFVSRLDIVGHQDRPSWMGHVGFSDLKLKLMASIVAISAIHVLESFMNAHELSNRDLAWDVGIHMAFVVSALLLAVMDRISGKDH